MKINHKRFIEPEDIDETIQQWLESDFSTPTTNSKQNANKNVNIENQIEMLSLQIRKNNNAQPNVNAPSTEQTNFVKNTKKPLDRKQLDSIDELIKGLYLTPKIKMLELEKQREEARKPAYSITITPAQKQRSRANSNLSTPSPVSSRPTSARSDYSGFHSGRRTPKKKEPVSTFVIRLTVWERLKQGSIKRAHRINEMTTSGIELPMEYLDETNIVNIFHNFLQTEIINNKNRKHKPFFNIHTLVKLYMKKRDKDDEFKKMKDNEKFKGLIRNKDHLSTQHLRVLLRNIKPERFQEEELSSLSKQERAKTIQEQHEKFEKLKKKDEKNLQRMTKIMGEINSSQIFNSQLQKIEKDIFEDEDHGKRRVSFKSNNLPVVIERQSQQSFIKNQDNLYNSVDNDDDFEKSSSLRPQSAPKKRIDPAKDFLREKKSIRRLSTNFDRSDFRDLNKKSGNENPGSFLLTRTLTEAKLKLFVPYTPNKIRTNGENIVRKHNSSWTHEQFTNMENPHDVSDYKPQTMVMNYYRKKIEQNLKKLRATSPYDIEDDENNEDMNPHRGASLVLEFQKMVLNDHQRPSSSLSGSSADHGSSSEKKHTHVKRSNSSTPRVKVRRKPLLDTNMGKAKKKGLPD